MGVVGVGSGRKKSSHEYLPRRHHPKHCSEKYTYHHCQFNESSARCTACTPFSPSTIFAIDCCLDATDTEEEEEDDDDQKESNNPFRKESHRRIRPEDSCIPPAALARSFRFFSAIMASSYSALAKGRSYTSYHCSLFEAGMSGSIIFFFFSFPSLWWA